MASFEVSVGDAERPSSRCGARRPRGGTASSDRGGARARGGPRGREHAISEAPPARCPRDRPRPVLAENALAAGSALRSSRRNNRQLVLGRRVLLTFLGGVCGLRSRGVPSARSPRASLLRSLRRLLALRISTRGSRPGSRRANAAAKALGSRWARMALLRHTSHRGSARRPTRCASSDPRARVRLAPQAIRRRSRRSTGSSSASSTSVRRACGSRTRSSTARSSGSEAPARRRRRGAAADHRLRRGRGKLRTWLRVSITREVFRQLLERTGSDVPIDEGRLRVLPFLVNDPRAAPDPGAGQGAVPCRVRDRDRLAHRARAQPPAPGATSIACRSSEPRRVVQGASRHRRSLADPGHRWRCSNERAAPRRSSF